MGVGRGAASLIMTLLTVIIRLSFQSQRGDGSVGAIREDVLKQIPSRIETALAQFKLDGRTTAYALCTKCHCTYKPEFQPGSTTPIYPRLCSNRPLPESEPCNKTLVEDLTTRTKPRKTFVYHSFHDYLSGLLSRPDLEFLMDKSCDDFMRSLNEPRPAFTTNVFEADFLRTFSGPQSGKLFLDREEEGRYGFTLNVDFFNVEGMRTRGATTSCGIISMACLNLPADLRYKPENMYLAGIIPGPREPHLTEINHYTKPLIDDLVESWERGVRFSRTGLHRNGRVTRSAVVAAVNDLPGARKLAAFAAPTSHFYCTVCQCKHTSTLNRYDHRAWVKGDTNEMRRHAEEWKNASSSKEQEQIFTNHGTRYSEMWRLPYWDPARQLVIDGMHCILEGLVKYHFRDILKLSKVGVNAPQEPAFVHCFRQPKPDQASNSLSAKETKQVANIHKLLTAAIEGNTSDETDESLASLQNRLHNKHLDALAFVGSDLGITFDKIRPTKMAWAQALVAWVDIS